MAASAAPPVKGLEGIVATKSSICWIDGTAGVLAYRGIDIHELAEQSDFEETTYLLWYGRLPNRDELAKFHKELAAARTLDSHIYDLLRMVPRDATPMEVLRTAVSLLSLYDPDEKDSSHDANLRKAYRITSQIAMIVAVYDRIRKNLPLVDPDPSLSHSANFLKMLTGKQPLDEATRALDVALILQADHELNASTFAARVIASTRAGLTSAVLGGISALKGPLHGGAPGPVIDMLDGIGTPSNARAWIEAALARGDRLMGFGHRIYKVRDPRADALKGAVRRLTVGSNIMPGRLEFAEAVEAAALAILKEKKPNRPLDTNVEFYTALLLEALAFPPSAFTCVFAMGRAAGWLAHAREQLAGGRLIRPQSRYIGPAPRKAA